MAEIVVMALIQKLGMLLADEARLLEGVEKEVESLHRELILISPPLRNADIRSQENEEVKEWVSQIRDLGLEVEDLIDVFLDKVLKKRLRSVVWKIKGLPNKVITLHKLGRQIEESKKKFNKLAFDRLRYGIQSLNDEETSQECPAINGRRYPVVHKGNIMDFQNESDEVAEILMRDEPQGKLGVVSVLGMGGSGKTTLARKVYIRRDIRRHFDCFVWVYVSRDFRIGDLQQAMLEQVVELTDVEKQDLQWKEGKLEMILHNNLKNRNYLIVFDNLWRQEAWDSLKRALPLPQKGRRSRVLLTTRDEQVSKHANPLSNPYKLPTLNEVMSLKLFTRTVFGSEEANLPKDVQDLAKKIVAKSDGFPLSIVVLGGLLSTKGKTVAVWTKFLESVNWHGNQESSNCQKVLAMSYTELPYFLKSCFLYFCLFPDGYEIHCDKLVRLWVAEGFLQSRADKTMEDVAADCIAELIQRNMIQVVKWRSNGTPETCCVHGLLRDMAISVAKKDKFLNISRSDCLESSKGYRRLAFHPRNGMYDHDNITSPFHMKAQQSPPPRNSNQDLLHSFLCFTEYPRSINGKFELLRVLDLEGIPGISTLPREIEKLTLLKYLSLRRTNIQILPSWVGNLRNLQTLDLYHTKVECLPIAILKLDQLRHLICINVHDYLIKDEFIVDTTHSPPPIKLLRNLQTLWLHVSGWIMGGLDMLINLRELRIRRNGALKGSYGLGSLYWAIARLVKLRVLWLEQHDWSPLLLPSFSIHLHLYDMVLIGAMKKLPEHNDFPPNLTSLRLDSLHLTDDPMVKLDKLPNLRNLTLDWYSFNGDKMTCSAGGFPKLESLSLVCLLRLQLWMVEKGALPMLRFLNIKMIYQLKMLPDGLRHLRTLEELTVVMSKNFNDRVKEGGEDWEKIKHISSINVREVTHMSQFSKSAATPEQLKLRKSQSGS